MFLDSSAQDVSSAQHTVPVTPQLALFNQISSIEDRISVLEQRCWNPECSPTKHGIEEAMGHRLVMKSNRSPMMSGNGSGIRRPYQGKD